MLQQGHRAVEVDLGPVGSVVNAPWPIAVTGFCAGPYEKIMNACFEIWSEIMPERAMACAFNLEYLLVGGRDARSADQSFFMWYDWMVGGWGGRNGKDGSNATAPVFGVGLAVLPCLLGDSHPALRRVKLDASPPGRDVWLGYHRDLRRLPRLRALVDLLVERLGSD